MTMHKRDAAAAISDRLNAVQLCSTTLMAGTETKCKERLKRTKIMDDAQGLTY